jgi:hypothetical protein
LRAHNLNLFVQLADEIDDDTCQYHLRHGHHSSWFRNVIKDEELASRAADVEQNGELAARESRERIRDAVQER